MGACRLRQLRAIQRQLPPRRLPLPRLRRDLHLRLGVCWTVTSSGKDAYFFTRDSLAPQDENGPTMKLYDAREGGGFPFLLPQAGCRSSDECHGAASPLPPPIENGAESGIPHNAGTQAKPGKCPKGRVRRHGSCVKKPRKPHHHKHKKRGHQ